MRVNRILAIFVAIFFLVAGAKDVFGLSPQDIVIVYNATMEGSKDIALYYAKKREIPESNLVEIFVSNSERISRLEFEKKMIPTIRSAVKNLKKVGNTLTILLVYGVPIYIKDPLNKQSDNEFMILIENKVKEYQILSLKLSSRLDHLVTTQSADSSPNHFKETYGTADVLKIVGKSVTGAIKYLNIQPQQKEKIQTYIRISSLIIRLTGLSPTARMVKKQLFEKKDEKSVTVEHKTLLRWHAILEQQLSEMKFRGVLSENALEEATIIRLVDGVIGELRFWEGLREIHSNASTSASVDSELTLILAGPYQRAGWLPNPFLRKYDAFPSIKEIRENTIMVGRLDGPTPELTKRMIDDAIETENIGLDGIFYIDARGLKDKGTHDSYWWYDQHLTNLYNIVKNDSSMRVIVDDKPDLFPPGACPNAALYCGWYSLANYIDAFKWQTGAVGFHVASAEARTLRRQGSNVWCKRMIEEGVAATLGPVEEPYLLSFPLPDIFFPLLMTGKLPILEVYFRSTPYLSWRQIFIGDPLYTPFQKNPAIDLTKVKKNE